MGLPGAIFLSGISESWIAISLTLDAWTNWKLMAGRLHVYIEYNGNALILPDRFTEHFEDKSRILCIISALVILLFFTIYCASGIVADVCLSEDIFGMSYETALWAGAAATIFYISTDDFLAVSWIDTVQAGLTISTLILMPIIAIISVGGFGNSLGVIKWKSIGNADILRGPNFVAIISLMDWGLGYFGQPHILARLMAADSYHSIIHVCHISMAQMILCPVGAAVVGLFEIVYLNDHLALAGTVDQNAGRASIELAQILLNPWTARILLSAILAAVMSTLGCQLLVCFSAVTEDLYRAFLCKHASQRGLVWTGHVMVPVVALVAITLAANPENHVLGLVSYMWADFDAAFGSVVLFLVMWLHMTRNGMLVGMIIGALTAIVWKQFGWLELYEVTPGFIPGSIRIIVFNLPNKAPSMAIQERLAGVDARHHSTPSSRLQRS